MILLLLACGLPADLRAGEDALARSDLQAAEAAYRSALARDPTNADALYGLGWTYHLAGEPSAARDAFDQCVRVHPESALGYKGLGSVAMADGQVKAARDQFDLALARAPGDRRIRLSIGLLDLSSGRPEEALATFDALSTEEPGRAEFHQARAEALLRLDREEDALRAADRAVETAAGGAVSANANLTRARALLALTARRVDTTDCAGTAPPVHAWLVAADSAVDRAEATGVPLPALADTRREILRRRGVVDDQCPGYRDGQAIPSDG